MLGAEDVDDVLASRANDPLWQLELAAKQDARFVLLSNVLDANDAARVAYGGEDIVQVLAGVKA